MGRVIGQHIHCTGRGGFGKCRAATPHKRGEQYRDSQQDIESRPDLYLMHSAALLMGSEIISRITLTGHDHKHMGRGESSHRCPENSAKRHTVAPCTTCTMGT